MESNTTKLRSFISQTTGITYYAMPDLVVWLNTLRSTTQNPEVKEVIAAMIVAITTAEREY